VRNQSASFVLVRPRSPACLFLPARLPRGLRILWSMENTEICLVFLGYALLMRKCKIKQKKIWFIAGKDLHGTLNLD
jgi:hypothetical protein